MVLGIAVVLESLSLRTAMQESRPHRRGGGWLHFIRHTKNPELPVVLLEDTGALAGLALAIIGLGLAVATDEPRFDAIGSIAIGLLLGVIAVVLAVEMKSLLIGESAGAATRAALEAAMRDAPEVRSVIHTRTLQLGPEDLLVAAKLDFTAASTAELAPAIDAVEARIRAAVPEARLIFLEPDLDRIRASASAPRPNRSTAARDAAKPRRSVARRSDSPHPSGGVRRGLEVDQRDGVGAPVETHPHRQVEPELGRRDAHDVAHHPRALVELHDDDRVRQLVGERGIGRAVGHRPREDAAGPGRGLPASTRRSRRPRSGSAAGAASVAHASQRWRCSAPVAAARS